jgi:hypothetical protein
MNKLLTACFLSLGLMGASPAFAAGNPACVKSADDKKLAGAARDSHIKKCEKDMAAGGNAACEKSADDKKLAGAARTSHIKKCTEDAAKPAAAAAKPAPAGEKK